MPDVTLDKINLNQGQVTLGAYVMRDGAFSTAEAENKPTCHIRQGEGPATCHSREAF